MQDNISVFPSRKAGRPVPAHRQNLPTYLTPLVVLSAVPVGVVGVVLVLFVTGTALNVQSLLGVIFMVGIVVSNTVLLTDFAEHVRKTDRLSPAEAIRRLSAGGRPRMFRS